MYRKLRFVRQQRRLSQTRIAEILSVSKTTICKIEAGTRNPSIDLGIKLQKILNYPIDYLLEQVADLPQE